MSTAVDGAVDGREGDFVNDLASYRQGLRAFLADADWIGDWRGAAFDNLEDSMRHDGEVLARLYAAGWNRYGWPEDAGGFGGSELHRAVFYEELAVALLPVPRQQWSLETLGPATLKFAPPLAREYLPRYLSGAEWWGQGFSEPESGSDLASLRTRAVDDGDGNFVINGQKIWTSDGPTATRLVVLARTGTVESRHRGLTMFLVNADTPGLTVRPITMASGRRELAELFFDDVRVPKERLIGPVDGAWGVTMYLMQYERGIYGYGVATKLLTELGRLRNRMNKLGLGAAERAQFGRVYAAALAAQARSAGTVRRLAAQTEIGPDSSIDKLLFTRTEKEVSDLILDLDRAWLITGSGGHGRCELNTERGHWWYSRAATIMGGTAEIQRGIVADHILGLPKEGRK